MWHFLLRTADKLLLFFGSGRVLLCTSFLTSVSIVLWTHVSCLSYFMCHNFSTRAISLSLHCVFRGREVTEFFCLSAGFVFRDVARGSEPMIRFLTMVKALTSLVGMSFIPRKIPWMSSRTFLLSVSLSNGSFLLVNTFLPWHNTINALEDKSIAFTTSVCLYL